MYKIDIANQISCYNSTLNILHVNLISAHSNQAINFMLTSIFGQQTSNEKFLGCTVLIVIKVRCLT